MNRFNLERLKIFGTDAIIDGSGFAVLHSATGKAFGLGRPPSWESEQKFSQQTSHLSEPAKLRFAESDVSCEVLAESLDSLARHQKAIATTKSDKSLSDQGRATKIQEATTAAVTELAGQHASLSSIGHTIADQRSKLYAVPEASVADAITDSEMRSRFAAMSNEQQLQLLKNLDANPRALLALKRDPLPAANQRNAEIINNAWNAHVEKLNPQPTAALKSLEENHDWASNLVRGFARSISENVLNRRQLFPLAQQANALDLFEFTDDEVRIFTAINTKSAA